MTLSQIVRVRGTEVRYDVTGRGDRDLVLIHGHHAHHMWWHGIVPYLEEHWRVTRLDLSGHGDSGHRDDYDSGRVWTDDVRAVVKEAGCERPVLVGHSMGGRVAVTVAGGSAALGAGVIMFDSVIRAPADRPLFAWRPRRRPRIHPSRDAALGRFRLSPEQPRPPEPMYGPVAEHSIRPEGDGWTWKHDQRGLPGVDGESFSRSLAAMSVPLRYVRAGRSGVRGLTGVDHLIASPPPGGVQVIDVEDAHHHLVLDAPQFCARLIDRLAGPMLAADRPGDATPSQKWT